MSGGGQPGNTNANKGKPWANALNRALASYEDPNVRSGDALRKIANKVIEQALDGNPVAIKEIGDRMDGKPHQSLSGPENGPLTGIWTVKLVKPDDILPGA